MTCTRWYEQHWLAWWTSQPTSCSAIKNKIIIIKYLNTQTSSSEFRRNQKSVSLAETWLCQSSGTKRLIGRAKGWSAGREPGGKPKENSEMAGKFDVWLTANTSRETDGSFRNGAHLFVSAWPRKPPSEIVIIMLGKWRSRAKKPHSKTTQHATWATAANQKKAIISSYCFPSQVWPTCSILWW